MTNAANLAAFTADLKEFARKVELDVATVRKKIAFDLFSTFVDPREIGLRHPVDTGFARAGWAMSDGQPSTFLPTEGQTTSPSPESQGVSFQEPFGITWITNNVPYILRLEFDGHSQQAPQGWVRGGINFTVNEINSISEEL